MGGTTMAILGCGSMGTSILEGVLAALKQQKQLATTSKFPLPSRFIACVNRTESVAPLERRFREHLSSANGASNGTTTNNSDAPVVQIWQNNNAKAVKAADVVLLACQPSQAAAILSDRTLRAHLSHKLLLSICVGMSAAKIQELIYGDGNETANEANQMANSNNNNGDTTEDAAVPNGAPNTDVFQRDLLMQDDRCYIVHAMPNTASSFGVSATVLSSSDPEDQGPGATLTLPPELEALAEWVFSSIGTVTRVAPSLMNVASVTGASTPAFFASALEGVVRGAVGMGLSESDALRLAAQAMKGTAEMVLRGDGIAGDTMTRPDRIREKVMTPNGCTARGVGVLKDGRVEEVYAEAIRQAVIRVFELAKSS
jgi:pyrroline-5-carboxylate reductase